MAKTDFAELYNNGFMDDLTFMAGRVHVGDLNRVPEIIFALDDNERILRGWREDLLNAGAGRCADGLERDCLRVTERLIGCNMALCFAFKCRDKKNILICGKELVSTYEYIENRFPKVLSDKGHMHIKKYEGNPAGEASKSQKTSIPANVL